MPHLLRVYITRPRGEPSESKGWLGAAATRRLCRARQPCWGWLEHRRPAGRALVGAGASACALNSFRCMYQIVRGYPRSYLGCTVELDSHLGCSGAPKLVYIHVVQASGCVVIVRKSPHHPLLEWWKTGGGAHMLENHYGFNRNAAPATGSGGEKQS